MQNEYLTREKNKIIIYDPVKIVEHKSYGYLKKKKKTTITDTGSAVTFSYDNI